MELNIYNKKEVLKTYKCDTYSLEFGTVEDILELFDIDALQNGADIELIKMVGKKIPKCFEQVKNLLIDIFDGLTIDEIRHTHFDEIAIVIVKVIKYAINQISLGINQKN